jgi:alkanesulfonate monooxygenase SsuD/methylene tetrahydromethanopterin reductase-like flavin-dependent oxidoreductase (luciferase family)
MPAGWAAPCPVILPLRPTALVVEETAWLAARFPGRVGLGVAAGALPGDFELMGVGMDALTERFAVALADVTAALSGRATGALAGDPAVQRCAEAPVPILSAAMGLTAVRRAAAHGAGLLFDSLSSPGRIRELTDVYRGAGGTGPVVLIRRVWVGEPPSALFDRQLDVYRGYASGAAQTHWERDELVGDPDGDAIAQRVGGMVAEAGADAVNIRIHVPGVGPEEARGQIQRLGEAVVPSLRRALGSAAGGE